jgi:hypothetical protein
MNSRSSKPAREPRHPRERPARRMNSRLGPRDVRLRGRLGNRRDRASSTGFRCAPGGAHARAGARTEASARAARPANEFAARTPRCPPARTARATGGRCASANGSGCAPCGAHASRRENRGNHERPARRMNSWLGNRDVRLRGRLVQPAGDVPRRTGPDARRAGPTRAGEALFVSRLGARQGLPLSQRRVYPLRTRPAGAVRNRGPGKSAGAPIRSIHQPHPSTAVRTYFIRFFAMVWSCMLLVPS